MARFAYDAGGVTESGKTAFYHEQVVVIARKAQPAEAISTRLLEIASASAFHAAASQ